LTGDHDCAFAVVGIFDARARHVQNEDDGLVPAGALLRQDAVEAVAIEPERTEGIADGGRPVDAGDDAALALPVRAPAEGGLDDIRDAVGLAERPLIFEGLQVGAGPLEAAGEMVPADQPEIGRLDRAGYASANAPPCAPRTAPRVYPLHIPFAVPMACSDGPAFS
jgi:hypothetical protein